jgi:hypothetical protein
MSDSPNWVVKNTSRKYANESNYTTKWNGLSETYVMSY